MRIARLADRTVQYRMKPAAIDPPACCPGYSQVRLGPCLFGIHPYIHCLAGSPESTDQANIANAGRPVHNPWGASLWPKTYRSCSEPSVRLNGTKIRPRAIAVNMGSILTRQSAFFMGLSCFVARTVTKRSD